MEDKSSPPPQKKQQQHVYIYISKKIIISLNALRSWPNSITSGKSLYILIYMYTNIYGARHINLELNVSNLKHCPAHLLCVYSLLLSGLAANPNVDNPRPSTVLKWHLQNMAVNG